MVCPIPYGDHNNVRNIKKRVQSNRIYNCTAFAQPCMLQCHPANDYVTRWSFQSPLTHPCCLQWQHHLTVCCLAW